MKRLALVLLLLLCLMGGLLCYWYPPRPVKDFAEFLQKKGHALVYDKDLRFSGLNNLTEKELRGSLPLEKSVPWWLTHTAGLESELSQDPLVARAFVRRCGTFSWGCFAIEVTEREAAAIAVIGERAWILGEDGGFIAPLSDLTSAKKSLARYVSRGRKLPLVQGVMLENISPEVAKARFNYVLKAVAVIQGETKLVIEKLDLKENGESAVKFRELDLIAIFDLTEKREASLEEEARRFMEVLREFKGREHTLQSVDLAFSKLAVVKLTEEAEAAQAAAASASGKEIKKSKK